MREIDLTSSLAKNKYKFQNLSEKDGWMDGQSMLMSSRNSSIYKNEFRS